MLLLILISYPERYRVIFYPEAERTVASTPWGFGIGTLTAFNIHFLI